MPSKPIRTFFYCLLACLFSAACSARALAQQRQSTAGDDAWPFQFDLFQLLLEECGLSEIADLDQAFNAPAESVIVIASPMPQAPIAWAAVNQFIQEGGTVLLTVDQPISSLGIGRFMTGPVRATDPSARYGAFDDCVKVSDITNVDRMFNGIFTIVTNRSTWFIRDARSPFRWDSVARFPRECLPQASKGKPLLAVGRPLAGGSGMIIVSADASLFTNGMLWHGDNALLAIRIATALCEGGKKQLVFMADGQVLGNARQRFQMPSDPRDPNRKVKVPEQLPEPRLAQLLKLTNAVANEVSNSKVINEKLKQRPRNIRPAKYFRALLIALTSLILAWLTWKLLTTRPVRPVLLRRRPMRSAHELAGAGGADHKDYRQPASYLAREFCWQLTGSRHSSDWQKYAARLLAASPSLDGFEQRELTKIIDIASRGSREPINTAAFQHLGKTIAVLLAKHSSSP